MKLFDTLFTILLEQSKTLTIGEDFNISALKNNDDPEHPHYYLDFKYNPPKSYTSEKYHPTRGQIEELLAKLILDNDPRIHTLETFLQTNTPHTIPPQEPLITRLKKDHPDIIKKITTYPDDETLIDAAIDLILEVLKTPEGSNTRKLGRGDKESYEQFKYIKESNRFHYEEGDPAAYGHPDHEETFAEPEFREFLKKKGWITIRDGFVLGKGELSYMKFWLEKRNMATLRDYLHSQKQPPPIDLR